MITVKKTTDPYRCNACKQRQGTTEMEFNRMVVMLCDDCIEELKEALP